MSSGEDEDEDDYYDTVDLDEMDYEEDTDSYYFPCPCGDRFVITSEDLAEGEDIAYCPSCSLKIKVLADQEEETEHKELEPSD